MARWSIKVHPKQQRMTCKTIAAMTGKNTRNIFFYLILFYRGHHNSHNREEYNKLKTKKHELLYPLSSKVGRNLAAEIPAISTFA